MKKFWPNLKQQWPFLLVVAVGGFLRFYRLRDLTTFGGDQGIDYLNVANMLINRDPTFLGPITHVGIYLGPLYYYLLIPFFLLFRFNPIAAPVMFALFGTATVGLVYFLTENVLRTILSSARIVLLRIMAFPTALVYAVSPIILESSRAPSQPHLIPFFAALFLLSSIRIITKKANHWDMVSLGVSLGSTIQFHFLTFPLFLLAAATLLIYRKYIVPKLYWFVIPLVVLLTPWAIFEFSHQFFITHQVVDYLGRGEISLRLKDVLFRSLDLLWFSVNRLVGGNSQFVTAGLLIVTVTGIVKSWQKPTIKLLTLYSLVNITGLALYQNPLSNHYISALYPSFVILSILSIFLVFSRSVAILAVTGLLFWNVTHLQLTRKNGYTMPDGLTTTMIESVASTVNKDARKLGGSYNIANTLDGDTRAYPYRYLLTAVHRLPPQGVEQYSEVDRLYVVSRLDQRSLLRDQRWEILSFPVAKLDRIWESSNGIILYRLTRGTSPRDRVIEEVI